jgi:hypothetical protein
MLNPRGEKAVQDLLEAFKAIGFAPNPEDMERVEAKLSEFVEDIIESGKEDYHRSISDQF